MAIRKIWPTCVKGARSSGSRTHPVPSIAACVVGSASTARTESTVAWIAIFEVICSSLMDNRLSAVGDLIGTATERPRTRRGL